MTMCISILLALVVFLLLVSKILPPTSVSIPLIAKYLLFTFIMNIVTIVITVVIINWNFRTPRTHRMPRWIRVIFLDATSHVVVTCALLFYSYRYFAPTRRPPREWCDYCTQRVRRVSVSGCTLSCSRMPETTFRQDFARFSLSLEPPSSSSTCCRVPS